MTWSKQFQSADRPALISMFEDDSDVPDQVSTAIIGVVGLFGGKEGTATKVSTYGHHTADGMGNCHITVEQVEGDI